MIEYIYNQKGSIGVAMVVVLIAVMSGVSMASIAFRDSHAFRNQLDGVQQLHLIRSEVGRGRYVAGHMETLDHIPAETTLPDRSIRVEFGTHRTIYRARTKLHVYEDLYDTGYYIRTLMSAIRGGEETQIADLQSPVMRYSENKIRSLQTLAIFHYFSDIDEERDGVAGNIRFFAGDIVHGRVHSNSDIYMRANSWPTFHGLVSTAGQIRVYPGGGTNYPRDQIFRGPTPGLIEHYRRIVFDPDAQLVRRWGARPLGSNERDDAIAYVTVEGSTYEIWVGELEEENPSEDEWIEGVNQFTIYSSYPPYDVVGREIGVNRIPRVDTIWRSRAGGAVVNGSAFIPMQMWISGNFGGRQTWASSHDIFLKDDLTYQRTEVGMPPDGIDDDGNLTHPVNTTDYLGIISEESIIIQYGHRSPIDSLRYRPNTSDIYMYGAYCAVGQGEHTWDDGIFTFQYQFPKGATPPQYWLGEQFWKIDLHRFHYPTTTLNPWPLGLDYPWYNPLWPEPGEIYGFPGFPRTPNPHNAPEIVKLRGRIYLFGSVAQRRRGYVRRSGNVDFDTGLWDIHNELEPDSPPRFGAPAPAIGPTGYDKRYKFDTRFERRSPPHFPLVKFEGYDTDELMDLGYLTLSWMFKTPPSNF